MRHPLRSLLGQGAWYAVGNALAKVGGLILLPIFTDSTYLSTESFGLWGVFEVTVQLAIGILGLQLGLGLIRFYAEPDVRERTLPTVWWSMTALAAASVGLAALGVTYWVPAPSQRLYLLLVVYIALEMLQTVPFSLLRARERAGPYTGLLILKLVLAVGFSLLFLVRMRLELLGVVGAYAVASGVTLVAALAITARSGLFRRVWDRRLARRIVGFSAPLVLAGIGSMVLNASDRYVLLAFQSSEEVALYTLAAKFGGVVNMFAAQPLQMALLPILFRLAPGQREEVFRLLLKYTTVGFGLLVVGLAAFTGPVLHLIGADLFYQRAEQLVPWIGLGFAAMGVSVLFDGVLTLFHRTGTISKWFTGAAVLNLALNLVVVPFAGALGAAVTTLVSYGLLLVGRYHATRGLLVVDYPWRAVIGVTAVTLAAAFGSVLLPLPDGVLGWLVRVGIVGLWGGALLAARWFTAEEIRAVLAMLRPAS